MESTTKRIVAIALIAVIGVGIGIGAWVFLAAPTSAFSYPGAPASRPDVIKLGVIGDIGEIQGDAAWNGAYFAAKTINEAGGVDIGGTPYYVGVTKEDSDESNPNLVLSRGTDAARRLIYDKEVDYALGGFRSEAVLAYMEEFMDAEMLFIDVGASANEIQGNVIDDYETYKYAWRFMPINSSSLGGQILTSVSGFILNMNATYPNHEVKQIGILAEALTWTTDLVTAVETYVPVYTGGWAEMLTPILYDVTLDATAMNTHLASLASDGADVVIPMISAQGGILMMGQYALNQYDFLIFGIDVQGQLDTYWDDSNGDAQYQVIMQTLHRTAKTSKSIAFWDAFIVEFDHEPLYIAVGAYDAVMAIQSAIEATDSMDTLGIIAEMETWTTGNAGRPVGVGGHAAWWPGSHDLVAGYPYGYTLWCQWQSGGTKVVIEAPIPIPPFELYPAALATGTYVVAPWVDTAWS
ncbi:hypothetical protein LCGC14_1198550 [marine sediment metagenome]|uniref:Leucine-binding protein domain-containing protein n=1 Tax=marine sediment metagenome TaxID=412755 RepID=A0A0F9LHL7_9ZZZZ